MTSGVLLVASLDTAGYTTQQQLHPQFPAQRERTCTQQARLDDLSAPSPGPFDECAQHSRESESATTWSPNPKGRGVGGNSPGAHWCRIPIEPEGADVITGTITLRPRGAVSGDEADTSEAWRSPPPPG